MTTSPYDNLPLGSSDNTEQLEYIDVELEEAAAPDSIIPPQPIRYEKPASLHTPKPVHKPVQKQPVKTKPLDKPVKYSQHSLNNLCGIREFILDFEESLLVPDTMPDIGKILFAEGRADTATSDRNTYHKNDFLKGEITVYTIYQPAGDPDFPVDAVRSSIPFKTDKCWSDSSCDNFRAEVTIRSIAAELINERKFNIKGELLIRITEMHQEELRILEGSEDENLMLARSSIQCAELVFESEETTEISQEITLHEDQPSPVRILETSIRVVENHRQLTSGKLVINASIHSQILYLGTEDGHTRPGYITNKTDFTQFILVNDDTDASLIKTAYKTGDLKISIENQDQFLLKGNVTTLLQGFSSRQIPVVNDAYHKIHDLSFDTSNIPLTHISGSVNGEISAREVIDTAEKSRLPETLLLGSCLISSVKGHTEKGRTLIDGQLPVKLLALDEKGLPFVIETDIPLRGTLEAPDAEAEMSTCIFAYIRDFWFSKINSRQLEINVSISINIWLSETKDFITLENMCFAEELSPARRISMAVYAVSRGDTLWDIAKRYKCDPETLAQLNQIDPEKPLPAGMKLFVMK